MPTFKLECLKAQKIYYLSPCSSRAGGSGRLSQVMQQTIRVLDLPVVATQ